MEEYLHTEVVNLSVNFGATVGTVNFTVNEGEDFNKKMEVRVPCWWLLLRWRLFVRCYGFTFEQVVGAKVSDFRVTSSSSGACILFL